LFAIIKTKAHLFSGTFAVSRINVAQGQISCRCQQWI